MMKYWRKVAIILVAILLVPLMPVSVSMSASALTESQLNMFSQNNIFFYDPSGGCEAGGGNNMNYAGDTVWSDAEMKAIEANKPFYEAAAEEYGFSWTVLAIIHSMETSLTRYNPAASWDSTKSEGPYQLHTWALRGEVNYEVKSSLTDAEFAQATNDAARFISESYGEYDLNSHEGVMRLLVGYNGLAPQYIQKALDMGFSQAEANLGEGSVYVMNRYDAQRDPLSNQMSKYWPGRFVGDGKYDENSTTEVFGAYVKYEALGGPGVTCGNTLISGGMNLEQGEEFMAYYKGKAEDFRYYKDNVELDGAYLTYQGCTGGPLANCVTFVKWFLVKYTTLDVAYARLGNGRDVVSTLANMGMPTGEKPQPYAVFSIDSGEFGHTGVVLGVDEDNGKIIIGEAGCSGGVDFIGAKLYNLGEYTDGRHTYAYIDTVLSGI